MDHDRANRSWTLWTLLGVLTVLLWLPGCPTGPSDDDGGDDDGADDDGGDDDGGDDDGGGTEDICDDGVDNDGDGPIDCDDPDCDDFLPCTWPTAVNHNARFEFHSDVQWVDDCETRFSVHLTVGTQIPPCPSCDRTFEGPYNYTINTCVDLLDLIGVDLPDYGAYGIDFISENQWEIWSRDGDGVWGSAGMANYDQQIGHFELERVDNIPNVGTLITSLTFSDAP